MLEQVTTSIMQSPLLPMTDQVLSLISVKDESMLDYCIEQAERSYEEEEKRTSTVESKAATLASALGIATTIVVGGSGVFLSNLGIIRQNAVPVVLLIAALYCGALICLGWALWRALAAAGVSVVARPDPWEVVPGQHLSLIDLKRSELASFLVSYERNRRANDQKAAELRDGQRAFFWAALCVLAIGLIISIWVAVGSVEATMLTTNAQGYRAPSPVPSPTAP